MAKKSATKAVKRKGGPGRKVGSKLGGQYVGLLNAVNKTDKAKARVIQQAKGFKAAIAFLKSMKAKNA